MENYFEYKIRVRYADTDQMGFVYYGNYAKFLEIGRVETLRKLGVNYKELEEEGILLPVLSMDIKYYHPAKYDDILIVLSRVEKIEGVRVFFNYKIKIKEKLICEANTTLVFTSKENLKPCKPPLKVINRILLIKST